MNDDSIEFQPGEKEVPVTNLPENKNIPKSEQIFDISENDISPIKEEPEKISANQTFPIRKIITPVTPATPVKNNTNPEGVKLAPNLTWKIEQKDVQDNTAANSPETPTKNILDPNYINPNSIKKDIPVATTTSSSPIKLPELPETPAFKGTLDQKPHSFTPKSPTKLDSVSIKDTPAPTKQSFSTTPVNKPSYPATNNNPAPIATPPKPANPIPVQSTPAPTAPKETPTKITTNPEIPKTEKSFGSIPLKDLSKPLNSARNVPANPPAKTLGSLPETSEQAAKLAANQDANLKNLRTYESDVAEILARKKTSVASIAIAENKKEKPPEPQENKQVEQKKVSGSNSKFIIMLLSIILIAAGVFGAYYFYSKSPLASIKKIDTTEPITLASVIPTDNQVSIEIKNLSPIQINEKIASEFNKLQNPSTIKELVLTKDKNRVSTAEMLEIMDIEVPDILKRSLLPSWLLGIYTDSTGIKDIVVVTKTNFFQNTFAGMLQWENLMADELKLYLSSANSLYATPVIQDEDLASTTDNNIQTIDPYFTIRGQFEDRIIANKDVRVFKNANKNTLFLYSFINNSTLLFSTKEGTVSEVIKRLENQAFVR